jgi:hypothetical protein
MTVKGRLQPAPWVTLEQRCASLMPPDAPKDSDLGEQPSGHGIIAAFQRRQGGGSPAPDYMFEPSEFRSELNKILTGFDVTQVLAEPRTGAQARAAVPNIWDCLVRNLGFWMAVAAVVFVLAVFIAVDAALVASGGLLGVAFWAAFWPALAVSVVAGASLWVITVIVSCLMGWS